MKHTVFELHGDDVVRRLLRGLGMLEEIDRIQPTNGIYLFEEADPFGVAIFLGRFANGKSLGWIVYQMPGAKFGDEVCQRVRDMISKTYPGDVWNGKQKTYFGQVGLS